MHSWLGQNMHGSHGSRPRLYRVDGNLFNPHTPLNVVWPCGLNAQLAAQEFKNHRLHEAQKVSNHLQAQRGGDVGCLKNTFL